MTTCQGRVVSRSTDPTCVSPGKMLRRPALAPLGHRRTPALSSPCSGRSKRCLSVAVGLPELPEFSLERSRTLSSPTAATRSSIRAIDPRLRAAAETADTPSERAAGAATRRRAGTGTRIPRNRHQSAASAERSRKASGSVVEVARAQATTLQRASQVHRRIAHQRVTSGKPPSPPSPQAVTTYGHPTCPCAHRPLS